MTTTILILIIISAISLGVLGVYFYDKKLVKEIKAYEERMQKKGHFKRHFKTKKK